MYAHRSTTYLISLCSIGNEFIFVYHIMNSTRFRLLLFSLVLLDLSFRHTVLCRCVRHKLHSRQVIRNEFQAQLFARKECERKIWHLIRNCWNSAYKRSLTPNSNANSARISTFLKKKKRQRRAEEIDCKFGYDCITIRV